MFRSHGIGTCSRFLAFDAFSAANRKSTSPENALAYGQGGAGARQAAIRQESPGGLRFEQSNRHTSARTNTYRARQRVRHLSKRVQSRLHCDDVAIGAEAADDGAGDG